MIKVMETLAQLCSQGWEKLKYRKLYFLFLGQNENLRQ